MLRGEVLEPRLMFAGPSDYDVNGDGYVTPVDVLQIVNAINKGDTSLKNDVNKDNTVTPIDALIIINWLNENRQATHILRVQVRDVNMYGLTDEEVNGAIDATFEEFEALFDVDFRRVPVGQAYDFYVTTYELYLGPGQGHAGGWFNPPREIAFHDGYYGPFRHSGTRAPINQPLYYQRFQPQHVQQIFGHEIGHYLGLGHSNNPSCRMHPNAPPGMCQEDLDRFYAVLGRAT